VTDAANGDSLVLLAQVVERARHAARARFSMQSGIGGEDTAPLTYTGVVDLRSGDFSSETICLVDGIHCGRESPSDPVWVSFAPEAGQLPISPLWLLLVLLGAMTPVEPSRDTAGDLVLRAMCDLSRARQQSSVRLAGIGGDNSAAERIATRVVLESATGLPRHAGAIFGDWSFACDFSDYGTPAVTAAPAPSSPVDAGQSPVRRWLTRRAPTLSIMLSPTAVARSRTSRS